MKGRSISVLVEAAARAHRADAGFPRDAALGLPVPVFAEAATWLYFPVFAVEGFPPALPEIAAPEWLLTVNRADAASKAVHWDGIDPTLRLGVHRLEPPLDWKAHETLRHRLWDAMDELLELGPQLPRHLDGQMRQNVGVARQIWQQIAHSPLRPYYRQINPAWFEFLGIA